MRAYKGTNHPTGAFLDIAAELGAEVVTPVAAEAMPSGYRRSAQAYDYLSDRIVDARRRGRPRCARCSTCTARWSPSTSRTGRAACWSASARSRPTLPIAVTFDMHGNMTQRIIDNATVINGYKSYPHTDMYVSGMQAGRALVRALRGEVAPVIAWGQVPILAQTLRMGTADEPMKTMQEMCRVEERDPAILAASVFGGFPMADIPDAGLSAIVVADGERAKADAACGRLLDAAWARKDDFVYQHEPLAAGGGARQGLDGRPGHPARPCRQCRLRRHLGLA